MIEAVIRLKFPLHLFSKRLCLNLMFMRKRILSLSFDLWTNFLLPQKISHLVNKLNIFVTNYLKITDNQNEYFWGGGSMRNLLLVKNKCKDFENMNNTFSHHYFTHFSCTNINTIFRTNNFGFSSANLKLNIVVLVQQEESAGLC